MSDMSRHELKQNELADMVVLTIEAIKNNRVAFLSAAGTIAGVLIFAGFFFTRYHTLQIRAADKLSSAAGMISQGQAAQGVPVLDEIIQKFSRTEAASQARLMKADYLILQRNFVEAESLVSPVIHNGKPKTIVPLAYAALGNIQEEAGNTTAAVATYRLFLERFPGHFLAPKAYESLARLYTAEGSASDAQAVYEKLITLYPATGWAERAQQQVSRMPRSPMPLPAETPQLPSK